MTDIVTIRKQTTKITVTDTELPVPPEPVGAGQATLAGERWDRIIRGIIYALAFLLPLLFTPWTFEPLEFSKQMLLFVAVSAAVLTWLLKLLVLRQWQFVKTPLDVPILVFLGLYLLASLFSVDRVASFLGFYGSFSGNFFQVLFLILFYYLVVNHFNTPESLKKLLNLFSLSVAIALIYAVLQFFGLFIFRLPFTKIESFNTVGGLLTLSLLSVLYVVLALGQTSDSWFGLTGKLWKILGLVSAFLILLTVNFIFAWVALLLGALLFMVFQVGSSGRRFAVREYVAPLVVLIVVVALLIVQLIFPFISPRNIFSFNLPLEVRLDYKTAGPVLTGVLKNQPILGSGPNTFLYAFSQYRDPGFNLSPFWNVRFDKAPSEAAEHLVGAGLLGFLAFEILTVIFLIYGFVFLLKRQSQTDMARLALTSYAGFAVLWLAHWFFFFNSLIAFAFWLTLAGFLAAAYAAEPLERARVARFSLTGSPRKAVSLVTVASLGLVLVIVFLFFASSVYASDIFYRQGLANTASPEQYDEAQADLERAIRLNRFRPDYYLTYGEFLTVRINQELTSANPNLGLIQQWLAASINTSRAAVDLSPNNWTSWERLANLYGFARPLVAGVDRFIIDSLTRATQSDPQNPILFAELGQVYRLAARRIDPAILGTGPDTDADGLSDSQEQALGSNPGDVDSNGNNVLDGNEVLAGLNPAGAGPLPNDFLSRYLKTDPEQLLKSEEALRKAVELKRDYAAAYLELSATLQQASKPNEAIAALEQALQTLPTNINLKFELGRLYFNSGRVPEAIRQFQEVLALVPTHANARFSLALSFERQGNLPRALTEYRRVLELNPDSEALKQTVVRLEAAVAEQAGQ